MASMAGALGTRGGWGWVCKALQVTVKNLAFPLGKKGNQAKCGAQEGPDAILVLGIAPAAGRRIDLEARPYIGTQGGTNGNHPARGQWCCEQAGGVVRNG